MPPPFRPIGRLRRRWLIGLEGERGASHAPVRVQRMGVALRTLATEPRKNATTMSMEISGGGDRLAVPATARVHACRFDQR